MNEWRSVESPPEHRGDVWVWPLAPHYCEAAPCFRDAAGWYCPEAGRWYGEQHNRIHPRLWREIDWPPPPEGE